MSIRNPPSTRNPLLKPPSRSSVVTSVRVACSDTGEVEKPKVKKVSEAKAGQNKSIFGLYSNWRVLLRNGIGLNLESDTPVGSDFGHIRNVLKFFVTRDKTFEAMEFFVSHWKDIQAKFAIARNKDIPTLYLLDVLKQDVLGCMSGVSTLKSKGRAMSHADGQLDLTGKSKEEIEAYFRS